MRLLSLRLTLSRRARRYSQFRNTRNNPQFVGMTRCFSLHDDLLFPLSSLWPLLTLLYYTGVRVGEATKIMWFYDGFPQVDLEKRQITLLGVQTKNGQPRTLPLTHGLVDMLKKRSHSDGPVFDSTNFRKEFASAKVKAKCPHVLIHDFRRSAVSNLVNAGGSETDTMEISGHRSRTVFDRYSVRNAKRLHEAMFKAEKSHSLVTAEAATTS